VARAETSVSPTVAPNMLAPGYVGTNLIPKATSSGSSGNVVHQGVLDAYSRSPSRANSKTADANSNTLPKRLSIRDTGGGSNNGLGFSPFQGFSNNPFASGPKRRQSVMTPSGGRPSVIHHGLGSVPQNFDGRQPTLDQSSIDISTMANCVREVIEEARASVMGLNSIEMQMDKDE